MKRNILIGLTLIAAFITASAEPTTWTLDSCIRYAIDHNISIKSRRLSATQAELAITEAKDRFLPTVDAGASQTMNFGRGLTSENTYADRNTSQFGWNISLSLPLFQGLSAKRQLDYSRANLEAVLQQVEAAKDDIELQVISLYLQALYTRELHEISLEQVRISEVELERVTTLLDAGKIAALELTQAESQLAQDRLAAVNASNDHQLALLDLAQALQLDDYTGFNISPLADDHIEIPAAEAVYSSALTNNHALRASQLSIVAAEKNISLARTGYIPRLSFNAGLGSSFYNISGITNPSFGRQMRDNFNKMVGFTLAIPIFDAFSTRNAVRRAEVETVNARLQRDDTQSNLHKAIRQAWFQADASRNKLAASAAARDAAKAALEAMQEKVNFGRASATDFEQAKSTYIKASCETVRARYEALLRIRILQFYQK